MSRRADELNTTSYAMLGMLAIRPWSTYELAKQIRRNLRFFWPRAESGLYDEPKNLVEHGLALSERSLVGRRPRTAGPPAALADLRSFPAFCNPE